MNGTILLNRFVFYCWISISLYNALIPSVSANDPSRYLNAERTPLRALSTPGNFYFLEFPVNEIDMNLSPICADGSPFSFAFRRGTDEHLSKLLIEFEGGPACWSDGSNNSCCDVEVSDLSKQVPWSNYYSFFKDQIVFQRTLPEIGACRGVASGFLSEAADVILSDGNGMKNDLPIPLRDDQDEGWWENLGGEGSDIRDWSYILIPHCSMDWFLGHQDKPQPTSYCGEVPGMPTDAVYHRGGTNVDAVIRWVKSQFTSGLDALVTTAGGKIGGCSNTMGPAMASSIAPAILAEKLSPPQNNENDTSESRPSTLVVTEGSGLFDPSLPSPALMANRWNSVDLSANEGLPGTMEDLISSSSNTQYVWMTSEVGKASSEESLWFIKQTDNHSDKFHFYEPQSIEGDESTSWCPLYTFPESDADVSEFFDKIIENMSWSSTSESPTPSSSAMASLPSSYDYDVDDKPRSRLTFLTISIIIFGLVVLAWVIYFIVKRKNSREGNKVTLSPTDLWFIALTQYPLAFYFVSLLVPIVLSTLAFSQNDVRVNMDFDSYLQVNTDLENVKRNYNEAQESQQASLDFEAAMCQQYGNSIFGNRKLIDELESEDQSYHETLLIEESIFGNESQMDDWGIDIQIGQKLPLDMLSAEHRELSTLNYFSGGEWISIMYQNRKGGNVFEPEVLKAIHEFESAIYEFPGFTDYCYGFGPNRCLPIDSLAKYFFNNGEFVSNPDDVLRSFLVNKPALWKLDQYFGPDNLESNVMRSFVFLKDFGGDQSAAHPFLRRFYRDFLLKHDQKRTYPAMIHTWNNFVLKQTEADDALFHDTLWSIGSLCFIAIMILLKVQSLFVVCSSMLGLVLAFSVSYYWVSAHFLIQDITLIWVAGLFVMLGIGADDIFLMVDSFEHTRHEFEERSRSRSFRSDVRAGNDENHKAKTHVNIGILQKRMKVAYMRAGSMMLVSSVTTAICFFSNAFGVLTVIQEFGIFMGMVVLINYLHVMTILPSSILVNEIYIVPFRKDIISRFERKSSTEPLQGYKSASKEYQNEEESNEMNRLDRYLVQTYAPFVSRRSTYLIALPIVMAIVLGVVGALNFSMNDGTIVLYSDRYNLGRLVSVTDRYFNDGEDVFTTIEKDVPAPTFAPKLTSAPTAAFQEESDTESAVAFEGQFGGTIVFDGLDDDQTEESGSDFEDPGVYFAGTVPTDQIISSGGSVPAGGSSSGGSSSVASTSSTTGNSSNGSATKYETTNQDNNVPKPTSDDGLRRRESIQVKLIWGVSAEGKKLDLWMTNSEDKGSEIQDEESSPLNLADPRTQAWLIEVVEMAKAKPHLFVRADKLTWIERLRDFAKYAGVEFPIPEHLFSTYLELFKLKDPSFRDLIQKAIGTTAPGLGGDYTFTSISMMVDMVENEKAAHNISLSEKIYTEWTEFAQEANDLAPPGIPKVTTQSSIFLDAYRVEATIDSTLVTWFVANGLCLLVILVFIQNLALSFMVMVTIILILFCLGGLLFAVYRIPFGPVEALGVSIFIGLSANYSLHVVHAYHHSHSSDRAGKIKDAAFAVGSPIIASALSTMGASAFLFGCRTWVFIELGLLICSITAMALLYTMTFLMAWLSAAGPVPIYPNDRNRIHKWDLKALCNKSNGPKGSTVPTDMSELDKSFENVSDNADDNDDDNRSVYSIEIVGDVETDLALGNYSKKGKTTITNDEYIIDTTEDNIEDSAKNQKSERSLNSGFSQPRSERSLNSGSSQPRSERCLNNDSTPQPERRVEDQWARKRPSVRSLLLAPKPAAETANGNKEAQSMFV